MTVSAIIATRDRPELLADCLASLSNQASDDFEVIVVDDGSTTDLDDVIAAAEPALPRLQYVRQEAKGLSAARNTGAEAATGDILAYLDDDTLVPPTWVLEMARAFEDDACAGVAGRVILRLETRAPKWLTPGLRSYLSELDLGDLPRPLAAGEAPVGANFAVRTDAFRAAGPFRTDLGRNGNSLIGGEEVEFFERVSGIGRICYWPEASVLHRVPADRLTRRFFRRRVFAQGVSDTLVLGADGSLPFALREVTRAGRAVPIAAKSFARGGGSFSAELWVRYCVGRLRGQRLSRISA